MGTFGIECTGEARQRRRDLARKLTLEDQMTARKISVRLGISMRTVQRYRGEMIREGLLRIERNPGMARLGLATIEWRAGPAGRGAR